MSNLTVFEFETQAVRFVGTGDNPWWVASDVCVVLELENVSKALQRLDDDEKRDDITISDAIGRKQNVWAINESGLYSLILKSRKPQAKRFKKWVTSEILPTIRQTGSYGAPTPQPIQPSPALISEAIAAILGTAGLHQNLIAGAVGNAIAKHYPELAPSVEEAKKCLPLPVEDKLFTATELAALYAERTGTETKSAIAMNKLLESAGLQKRNPEGKPNWLPIGQGNEFSQVVLETAKGRDKTIQTLKWYPSVVDYLLEANHG